MEVEKIATNRYRLRSRGQVMTVDAQALRDLTDWGLLHMRELEQEAKQAQPPAKSYEEIETEIQEMKESNEHGNTESMQLYRTSWQRP